MTTIKLTAALVRNQKLHLLHPAYGSNACIGRTRTGAFAVNETVLEIEGGFNWNSQNEEERKLVSVASRKMLVETLREIADGRVPFEAVCQRCLCKTHEEVVAWVAKLDESLAEVVAA